MTRETEKRRDRMILKMMEKANNLVKNYSWEGFNEIWDMCYDWNSTHEEDEEIFMCEREDEETGLVNGFYIEDDYWIFED